MVEISPLRRRMIENMTVRNLSPATQRSDVNAVSKFSRYFGRSLIVWAWKTRRCDPLMARGTGERAGRYLPQAKAAWTAWFIHRACLGTLLAASSLIAGHAGTVKSEPYTWTNVKWGGGGYVTGIVAHPSAPNLLYIRTDVGGCYRWDAANQQWILCSIGSHSRRRIHSAEKVSLSIHRTPTTSTSLPGCSIRGPADRGMCLSLRIKARHGSALI